MPSCNLAYTSAPDVMVCGMDGHCASLLDAGSVEGTNAWQSDNYLVHCSSVPGYIEAGVKKGDDLPGARNLGPDPTFGTRRGELHFRQCNKSMDAPGADTKYDKVLTEVYDGATGRLKESATEEQYGLAVRCCTGRISTQSANPQEAKDCGSLLVPPPGEDDDCEPSANCPILMDAYCLGEFALPSDLNDITSIDDDKLTLIKNRLEDIGCQSYCSDPAHQSDCTAALEKLCRKIYTLNGDQNRPEWDSICGCHYPDELYRRSIEALSEKYVIPEQFVGASAAGNRTCISSECSNSAYPRDSDVFGSCPGINLVSCITNASFEVFESDVDDINISQVNECPGAFNERNVTGNQAPATPPPTLDDLQATADQL